jgi:DNA polymerase I
VFGTFKRTDEAKRIVIDIETRDPFLKDKGPSWVYDRGHIAGIGIKIDNQPAEYYPIRHPNENVDQWTNKVQQYLQDIPDNVRIVGHYICYDIGWLYHTYNYLPHNITDTLLGAQIQKNNLDGYSLNSLSQRFMLGQKIEVDPEVIWTLPLTTQAKYCNHDVELTAKLDDRQWKERETDAYKRECKLIPILVRMKAQGIYIDVELLNSLEQEFRQKLREVQRGTKCENIWSNQALVAVFNRLNIDFRSTDKGNASFPQWFIESIDHPEVQAIAEARKIHRLINTFCVGLRRCLTDANRIHPDFMNGRSDDGGTITGRLSAQHVNVQQIPHRTELGMRIREVFLPDDVMWFKFDYKQQEPMLMLHYASRLGLLDDLWKAEYSQDDADFYNPISKMLNIDRQLAKTITLATCYNMGYKKFARVANISEHEAQRYLVAFNRAVPWLIKVKEYATNKALDRKYVITVGGRNLYFETSEVSKAFNHLIQGSAADQIKEAMIRIYDEYDMVPILQVHDELAYDFSEEDFMGEFDIRIENEMVKAMELDFPTRVDKKYGHNWGECG